MKSNRTIDLIYLCTLLSIAIQALDAHAQVELDRFFPPAVQRGIATTIKADGKFPQWPVKIECNVAGVSVSCGEKAGEFLVNPPATAVGAAWIRVHDDQSASSLVPLLMESTSVVAETEPNENLFKATPLVMPTTIVGKLEKNGDVDMWKVSLRTGEQLVASVTAHSLLASPMDSVLQLVDARGLVVSQAEDNHGLDPQLIFTARKDADYYLRLFCFPEIPTGTIGFAGGANFNYAMRVTTTAYLDHTLPFRNVPRDKLLPVAFGWNLSPGAPFEVSPATSVSPETLSLQAAQGWQGFPIQSIPNASYGIDEQTIAEHVFDLPLLYFGHILNAKEVDRVRIRVRSGVNYRATIESRDFGFKLDSVLRILKPDLKTQIAQNDDSGRGNSDSAVEFKPTEDGEVVVEVSDLADSGSLRHAYELQVGVVEPSVGVSVAADHFRVSIGKSLEIPVTIDRRSGFSQRLEFTAKNLPAGVTLEKANSEGKGDSAKSVKLKLNAAAEALAFQKPIELIATPVDDAGMAIAEPQAVKFTLRPWILLDEIWLTVAKDK
ncbi:MAG: serine protease [Pirellulaceae bacterium]|nr:serine protease [Pirellulaceae bacterium]